MNPRAKQLDHSDWKPLRSSKKYRDNYDSVFEPTIEGTNSRYRLVPREEVPFHAGCGGRCKYYPVRHNGELFDYYDCQRCGKILLEENGEVEWKPRPNDQS